jgi:hypothetical protein
MHTCIHAHMCAHIYAQIHPHICTHIHALNAFQDETYMLYVHVKIIYSCVLHGGSIQIKSIPFIAVCKNASKTTGMN